MKLTTTTLSAARIEAKPIHTSASRHLRAISGGGFLIHKVMNPATNNIPPSGQSPQTRPVPPAFDPSKYPHYSVQSSIYSLLLSALNMSEHYEKHPDAETRQKKLDDLVRDYQNTCEHLKIKS